jgi:uracil-DNA glycosylase
MGKHYKLFVLLGAHTTSIFSRLSGMPLAMGAFADVAVGGKKYAVLPIYHPSPINPKNRERNREIFRRHARKLRGFVK